MSKKKQKKEKIIYYDDGSTISDMSEVGGIGRRAPKDKRVPKRSTSTFKEKWATYWATVKQMLFPMFLALLILTVIFLFLLLFA